MDLKELYARHDRLIVPPLEFGHWDKAAVSLVAASQKEFERLGFMFTPELALELTHISRAQLKRWHFDALKTVKSMHRIDRNWTPMYTNFPEQVVATEDDQLYLNAMNRYYLELIGEEVPAQPAAERFPLIDRFDLKLLHLAQESFLRHLTIDLCGAKTALTPAQTEELSLLISHGYADDITEIPFKETMVLVCQHFVDMKQAWKAAPMLKTATDVLRFASGLSGGDVSLAVNSKFRTFSRPIRRVMLAALDSLSPELALEDAARNRERFIRLGEKLHPGDFTRDYPKAQSLFDKIRAKEPIATFGAKVEKALLQGEPVKAAKLLTARPGEFARRVDHLLRIGSTADNHGVLHLFRQVAEKVPAKILLQLMHHSKHRGSAKSRLFVPKGKLSSAMAIENTLPPISVLASSVLQTICQNALMVQFAALKPLGKVYVDPALNLLKMPSGARNASKSLRTIGRGSRIAFDANKHYLRLFLYWKQPEYERVDIDLSIVFFDADWNEIDRVSYFSLKTKFACHSGDITSASRGACEFIDVDLDKLYEEHCHIRYAAMNVHAFTSTPFIDLPECFAGWMMREDSNSGEIFDAKTVVDRFDLTSSGRFVVPAVFDFAEKCAVWTDCALDLDAEFTNHCKNTSAVSVPLLQAFMEIDKPSLGQLFSLHAAARGEQVDSPAAADLVIGMDKAIDIADIAANWI